MRRAQEVRRVDPDRARGAHHLAIANRRIPGAASLLNQRGQRRAGYDWHFGKGHIALRSQEPYAFTTVDQLLADFARDVERLKREEKP